ncbi:uncharacterized protein LOC105841900 [Bombyx mori]|uniref:Uncharacterized protein n=1 Tax=Bombyx mori TaxID=7091 RepID=A0A8R2QWR3_BOMMO|nr:uncharacterized protein LOC105841900 [Bombyx mori]
MVNQEVLRDYSSSIKNLKREAANAGISEEDFKKLYFESLKTLEKSERPSSLTIVRNNKLKIISVLLLVFALFNFKYVYSSFVCNLQEYIYPGLRLLRKISIPFISLFPALSEYYYETCLVQNPFFTVVDMDCWPCSSITNIQEIFDPKPVTNQHIAPFVYQTSQERISISLLKSLYEKNKDIFANASPKILLNNKFYIQPEDMFDLHAKGEKNIYVWKFNRMNEAKVLRQLIPRPTVVPKFGQSIERYLIIHTNQDSYKLPDTECNFSFVLSLSGARTLYLIPAEECKHQCRHLSIDLKEGYLLWYNWWYWRPKIQPTVDNTTFIGHIGSYC